MEGTKDRPVSMMVVKQPGNHIHNNGHSHSSSQVVNNNHHQHQHQHSQQQQHNHRHLNSVSSSTSNISIVPTSSNTARNRHSTGTLLDESLRKGVRDFRFGRTLGEGSYSTVYAATDRATLREYAIKVLDKRHIIKEKKVKYVTIEKNTLNRLSNHHPGIVKLYFTFQDERSLYFVLDLASGGELLSYIKQLGSFDEVCTRYYSAQILDAIEYMHSKGVMHRDLKPENVLLDEKMRVKITDFGTAAILTQNDGKEELERSTSFVGTAEYVSPELLTDKYAGKPSDIWAFGCILYQLLSGRPPFKASNEYQTFQKITHLEYTIPNTFPNEISSIIKDILVLDPSKRLKIDQIKSYPFYTPIEEWGPPLWSMKAPRLQAYKPPTKLIKLDSPSTSTNTPSLQTSPVTPDDRMSQLSQSVTTRSDPFAAKVPAPFVEWSNILQLDASETILRIGKVDILSSMMSSTPLKLKLLSKRKTRTLILSSEGRFALLSMDKKVKYCVFLRKALISIRLGKNGRIEIKMTDRNLSIEDASGLAKEWVELISTFKTKGES